MSKSIKLQEDTYLDSSSISHNKELLSDILNTRFLQKTLFLGEASNSSKMITNIGDVATLNDSIKNYDFIVLVIGTRVYNWTKKYEIIFTNTINIGTASNVRFVIPYSCYQNTTIYTIELGFTTPTTLQIYLNSGANKTNGSGGFIQEIIGVKLK